MGKVLIINGSPRAPKSNSRQYAERFLGAYQGETTYAAITRTNQLDLCCAMEKVTDVLFIFPLYADGIPVTLLRFLNVLENNPPQHKPKLSVLINCGFIEPEQNEVAVKMMRLYAQENGYPFGSVLKIGSGEAILTTPFRRLVWGKIKKLARSIQRNEDRTMQVTMPIPKRIFIRASAGYWEAYGRRNGISKEQMVTMEIEAPRTEGGSPDRKA